LIKFSSVNAFRIQTEYGRSFHDWRSVVPTVQTKNLDPSLLTGSKNWKFPESIRKLPFKFSLEQSKKALLAYRLFQADLPFISGDPYEFHGILLKLVVEYYSAFCISQSCKDFALWVGEQSISKRGFNDLYSKLWKYSRQAVFSKHWSLPDDWDSRLDNPWFSSWKGFQQFLLAESSNKLVERILPASCLFPWEDNLPEDIEILEEENPFSNSLNHDTIYEIIKDCLVKPTMLPTDVDFMLTHTDTKKCVVDLNHSKFEKLERKDMTTMKYVEVTKWVDKGKPKSNKFALRTPVWKNPSEYRDATTMTPALLYDVWKVNAYLKYSWSPTIQKHVGDYTTIETLNRFVADKPFLIHTDWKKSGLTMPHWFVKLVLRRLAELNPSEEFDFPVNGWPIYDHAKSHWFIPTDFGYGLGTINNIFTLYNIVLFKYAQNKNIFSEKDNILSFNDDSIISTTQEAYNQWLLVCRRSGGWPDINKTFSSIKGGQFCELHCFKDQINFKAVSMFHTLLSSLWKGVNYDHWRFLVSDMWCAVRGTIHYKGKSLEASLFTAVHYCQVMAGLLYGEIDYSIPPEIGGVSLGDSHFSRLQLKSALILIEKMPIKPAMLAQGLLRVYKECLQNPPSYTPWKNSPKVTLKTSWLS